MRCVEERIIRVSPKDGSSPYGQVVKCGKCYACRYNKTQMWIDRIEMEQKGYPRSPVFVTLTYRDDSIPKNDSGDPILSLRHMQLFFKSLRKELSPHKIRYIYLGEYGGQTVRPHYHIILFGRPGGISDFRSLIQKHWHHGFALTTAITAKRTAYVASFHINSWQSPPGRPRPFVQYSRNPGIGYSYLEEFANSNLHLQRDPDLNYVRLSGQKRPLPRYILQKLFPDGYPTELDIQPLRFYLAEKYPELSFSQAVQYVKDVYQHRLIKQLQKHGKYIQPVSCEPGQEVSF